MRAAIYTRLSRDKVAQESTKRQEKACRDYAEARGWKVAHVYTDVDLSAYRRGVVRPGFEAIAEHAKHREIDVVLFWKVDRLVRSPADFERLWTICEANDVGLAAVLDPVDTTTEIGMMIVRLLVGFARMESVNISTRVSAAKQSSAEQGRPPSTGRRPFGLTADWSTIVEDEAQAIRDGYGKVMQGWTTYALANHWNEQGLMSPSGNPWRSATVVQCLKSPRVAGLRIHRGRVVGPGHWPAILSVEQWERLQVVLTDPARGRGGGGPGKHLLTGLLRCHCGTSMSSRPKADGTRRYLCRREIGGCGAGIIATQTEDHVADLLFAWLEQRTDMETALDDSDPDGTLQAIRADEAQLEQLAADYADRLIGRDEWLKARDKVAARLEQARRSVTRWQPQVRALNRAEWEAGDLPYRRAILALVFERIVVHPSTGPRFDPDRIVPLFRV